jgi:hypothetical protein
MEFKYLKQAPISLYMNTSLRFLFVDLCVVFSTACTKEKVKYSFQAPEPNVVQFDSELLEQHGLSLNADLDLMGYGNVYFRPESATENFKFGFKLDTAVFNKESWAGFKEVTNLPTGARFPTWMTMPLIDVTSPPLDTAEAQWHFYFGTGDRKYVGAGAILPRIDEKFPSADVSYTFKDKKGRVIVAAVVFGPWVDDAGKLVVPGGVFVATDLDSFLPKNSARGVATATPEIKISKHAGRRPVMPSAEQLRRLME